MIRSNIPIDPQLQLARIGSGNHYLRHSHHMVFWKSLFSGGDTATEPKASTSNDTAVKVTGINLPPNTQVFLSTDRNLDLYELEELCDIVGWSRRPLRKVKKAVQNSFIVVSMWEVKGASKRMIGFARATSDGAFNATVWDVVVHPDYQGQKLGKAMMKYTIDKIRAEDISNITLFADAHVVGFYNGMGFVEDPEGIKGMFWYPD